MKKLLLMLLASIVLGCGLSEEDLLKKKQMEEEEESVRYEYVSAYETNEFTYFMVEGYISPINISVNGRKYRDGEEFYTQELIRLQNEAKKDYPDYKLDFNASVGLQQFKANMYVFLVAHSDLGVASESYVDMTGKFSFMLDGGVDKNALYTLRATKRISVSLTKGNDVIYWCYNMFAESNIALKNNPLILRNFTTSITKYQCHDIEEGISLPEIEESIEGDTSF